LKTEKISKTNATILISADEEVMAYYMRTLNGTSIPPFKEVLNGGPAPYLTTESAYGSIVLREKNVEGKIILTDLWMQTNYILYIYFYDKGNNVADVVNITFKTEDRPKAADF